MTKNHWEVVKFITLVLASVGIICLYNIETWNYIHVALFVVCVSVWVWYLHPNKNK